MFSRLAAVSALAFAVLVAAADSCNTGSMQCCNHVEDVRPSSLQPTYGCFRMLMMGSLLQSNSVSGSTLLSALAGLGVNVQDITGQIGLQCSPLSVVGVGAGNGCSASPVCCQNNNVVSTFFFFPLGLQPVIADYPRHAGWFGLDWLRSYFPLDSRGLDLRLMLCYNLIIPDHTLVYY